MPVGFATAEESIEAFIVAGATATAAKEGVRLFGQTSRPIRNTANSLDFTVPTESGDQYLDLLEVAPLSYVDEATVRGVVVLPPG